MTQRHQDAGLRSAAGLSPAELRERLAPLRPRETAPEPARTLAGFLTFWIAGEECALPLARAREIVRCEGITKVPDTPAWLRGVTNLRGTVVPVVDLAPRLGQPETTLGPRSCVLMLEIDWTGETLEVGLLVEAMGRVVGVAAEAIEAVPAFGTRLRLDLLAGLLPVGGRFASLLDLERTFSPSELLAHPARALEATTQEPTSRGGVATIEEGS